MKQIEEGTRVVTQLKCSVCTKFCSRIDSMQNFSHRWIIGAESIRTSNIRDLTQSEQHIRIHVMSPFNHELCLAPDKSVFLELPFAIDRIMRWINADDRSY